MKLHAAAPTHLYTITGYGAAGTMMKLPPVHLVGHSRGGYCAARVTLEHHDLVRSLTLVNSGTLSPGVGTNEVVLSRQEMALRHHYKVSNQMMAGAK